MNDENINNIINMNNRVLMLLGMSTALLFEIREKLPKSEHWKLDWLDHAITNVVYKNEPIPPMPEKGFFA